VFSPVSIGTQNVKIQQNIRELWSKIKWYIFMVHCVSYE